MQRLIKLGQQPLYWLALLCLGVALEVTALIYQYALDYAPCVMCIHVRLWVMALLLAALLGYTICKVSRLCAIAHALVAMVAVGLLERAWQLLGIERGFSEGACDFNLGMPAWLAFDEWLPAVFEVQTSCGYTPELLLGITMAEGLLALSVILLPLSLLLCMTLAIFAGRDD
jgi:disulfide bond formation protein DsbB